MVIIGLPLWLFKRKSYASTSGRFIIHKNTRWSIARTGKDHWTEASTIETSPFEVGWKSRGGRN